MITGMTQLGFNLRAIRGRYGITQGELSQRSGVPMGVIQRIEAGVTERPHAKTVSRIAEALDTTIEFLERHPDPGKGVNHDD